MKEADQQRLNDEYRRLVEGLRESNNIPGGEDLLAAPVLPADMPEEAVPGNIRNAQLFLRLMRTVCTYLKQRLKVSQVESESPMSFLLKMRQTLSIETRSLRFAYSRLNSLLRTLQVSGRGVGCWSCEARGAHSLTHPHGVAQPDHGYGGIHTAAARGGLCHAGNYIPERLHDHP